MSIESAADWKGLRKVADVARITLDASWHGFDRVSRPGAGRHRGAAVRLPWCARRRRWCMASQVRS